MDTNIPHIPKVQEKKLEALCNIMNPGISEIVGIEGFQLLDRLLDLDPTTRITAAQLVDHPYLAGSKKFHYDRGFH
jgi:hypothetical protein